MNKDMITTTDRDGNALEPGMLYAAFATGLDFETERAIDQGFYYWTGVELVDENGEPADIDIDYLVRQNGNVNEEMIDRDWIARMQDGAESAAEYYATGGDL